MRTDSDTVAAAPTTTWLGNDHRGTAAASASTGTAASTPRGAGRPVIRPTSATTTAANRATSVASWTAHRRVGVRTLDPPGADQHGGTGRHERQARRGVHRLGHQARAAALAIRDRHVGRHRHRAPSNSSAVSATTSDRRARTSSS